MVEGEFRYEWRCCSRNFEMIISSKQTRQQHCLLFKVVLDMGVVYRDGRLVSRWWAWQGGVVGARFVQHGSQAAPTAE